MKRDAYPLQWPSTFKRTTYRTYPKFREGLFAQVRDRVLRQLKMRGSQVVITSDLPLRLDGLPYANGRCEDPGVAVYWVEKGREHVIACDRWKSIGLNLRAVDLSLEAMRALDRWGCAEIVERSFAGFAALPAGVQVGPAKRPWREVLGVLEVEGSLFAVKAKHRELIRKHHPDAGGSHELAAEINAALAEAEQELS